jgi:hypothetical protein
MGQLRIHFENQDRQMVFNIHHFNPDSIREQKSAVNASYDYVVLSHGRYDDPVAMRLFFARDEIIALFDRLAPVVAAMRPPAPAAAAAEASASDAQEVALL